jgi:hypothetical protein
MKFSKTLTAILLAAAAASANAEGTAQLGTTQALRAGAVLYVDIIAPSVESIRWQGAGSVQVRDPASMLIATLSNGQSVSLVGRAVGSYKITVVNDQNIGSTWDVAVLGQTTAGGRLFSYNWTFNAGSFASSAATNGSFYAIVDGGAAANKPVIELKLDGLAGYVYDINANRRGVDGVNAGRSVPVAGNSTSPEFPIYLSLPSVATYTYSDSEVFGFSYVGGTSVDVLGNPMAPCQMIAPGQSEGVFQFTSQLAGTYHLQCDLNNNGFSDADAGDLLLVGNAVVGRNTLSWNGRQNGTPVAAGSYPCRLQMNVGEFHYVGRDIETSYEGMRLFNVNSDGSRTPLNMFWDDSLVQSLAINMPNGQPGLVSGGANGINAATYSAAAVPDVNARSWGSFVGAGKGNDTFLDTFVWLSRSTTTSLTVTAANTLTDSDGDGASDFAEACVIGSDPQDPDTDNDGIPDGTQYVGTTSTAQNGGLESNSRLQDALADRAIRRGRGVTFPALRTVSSLNRWMEGVALPGLRVQTATPDDLTEVTNASDARGFDLVDAAGNRRASVLLIATKGALYEHNKEICDRAHGAELASVINIDVAGQSLPMSLFRQKKQGVADFATSWKLYGEGAQYALRSGWLNEQYPQPAANQDVVNVQLWAANAADLAALTDALLSSARSRGDLVVTTPVPAVDDSQWTSQAVETSTANTTPGVFVQSAGLLGDQLTLQTRRRQSQDAMTLRVRGRNQDGQLQTVALGDFSDDMSAVLHQTLPLFTDLTAEVVQGDKVVDRVWLSDGSWARFDDGMWGGNTNAATDMSCSWRAVSGADITLAGCAHSTSTMVDTTAGVARHLTRATALGTYGDYLIAFVNSNRAGNICLESADLKRSSCQRMPAGQGWMAWPLAGFDSAVATSATLLSFTVGGGAALDIEVSGLSLAKNIPAEAQLVTPDAPTTSNGGCDAQGGTSRSSSLLSLLLLAIATRIRRK